MEAIIIVQVKLWLSNKTGSLLLVVIYKAARCGIEDSFPSEFRLREEGHTGAPPSVCTLRTLLICVY